MRGLLEPSGGCGGRGGGADAVPLQMSRLRGWTGRPARSSVEAVADAVVCGPDPDKHIAAITKFIAAGVPTVHLHQVGPDQRGFLDFYQRKVLPVLQAGDFR